MIHPLIRIIAILGVVILGFSLGCNNNPTAPATTKTVPAPSPVTPTAPGFFRDMTKSSGIDFTYHNGEEAGHFAILDSLGGGVMLIDYDQDGLLDIFLTGGGHYKGKEILGYPCKLYRNEGNWKFRDVTAEAGLDKFSFYTHGGAVGDYDNDGWTDLLVTGYGQMILFRNNKGKFEDVTKAAGLTWDKDWHWSTSAGFADLNGDGRTDLFVTHYVNWHITRKNPSCKDSTGVIRDVCSPKQFDGLQPYLYLNNGDGTFRDGSKDAGLKPAKGLGCVLFDVNHDGLPDIYIASDTTANYFYLNRGGGKFEEMAEKLNIANDEDGQPNGSMGLDAGDYNRTGHFSILVANYQHEAHALYRNKGKINEPFGYASHTAGLKAIGLIYVAFGTGFFDFDLDGNEDILFSNGHVVMHPPPPGTLKERPVLLRNLWKPSDKDRPFAVQFKEVTDDAGPYFQQQRMGRGVAFGDLDNDGRIDLVFNHMNEPVAVLRNEMDTGHHWLGIRAIGQPSRDAVGAELTLEVDGEKLVRQVKNGGSYCSASDRRLIFGLGKNSMFTKLTIKWPSGKSQSFDPADLPIDRYHDITEGQPKPQPAKAGPKPMETRLPEWR